MLYRTLKRLIEKDQTEGLAEKIDIFFAADKLTEAEYNELTAMLVPVSYTHLDVYKRQGYKDKLVKLDSNGQVDNKTAKNEPNFKNINSYAVNGAVHYANALLHHTSYTDTVSYTHLDVYKRQQYDLQAWSH